MSFSNPPKPTTQDKVLREVVNRIVASYGAPFDNERAVIVSLDPWPQDKHTRQNQFILVSPMDGTFDQELLQGGGSDQCVEQAGVIISAFFQSNTDNTGRAEDVLFGTTDGNKSRSLLDWKRRMLILFTSHMLLDSDDGEAILVAKMQPVRSQTPRKDHEKFADLSIAFSTEFQWELS